MIIRKTLLSMRYSLLLLIFCTMLSACARERPATSCTIFDDPARTLSFDDLDDATALAWISESYDVPVADVRTTVWSSDAPRWIRSMTWNAGARSYSLDIEDEGAFKLSVRWSEIQPSLALVIDCLGPPTAYIASSTTIEATTVILILWYPDQGLAIEFLDSFRGSPPQHLIQPGLLMNKMTITRPGSLSNVVHDVLAHSDLESTEEAMGKIREWAGLEEIVIVRQVR